MPHTAIGLDKRRGRPKSIDGRCLYDDLIEATRRCLQDHDSAELTAKTIANRASTTEGMVNYYFRSKEYLLAVVMQQAIDSMCQQLRTLKATIMQLPGSPTWYIVELCWKLSRQHVASTRIHADRHGDLPVIRDQYYQRLTSTIHNELTHIIQMLVDNGIYSPKLDVRFATFSLTALLTAPDLLPCTLKGRGLTSAEMNSPTWLNFIASTLDHQFRDPRNLNPDIDPSG